MRCLKSALLALMICAGLAMAKDAPPIHHGSVPAGASQLSAVRAAQPDTWINLLAEDFEGGFPGAWQIINEGQANAYWGAWTCWSGDTPSHSVGCAAGGAEGISCGLDYPDEMATAMRRGPFNLANEAYTAAELRFKLRVDCEYNYDFFYVRASTDGVNFYGYFWTGTVGPETVTIDLTTIPTLGNLLGQSQVWISFEFFSDGSVAAPNGAQVDDVVLRVLSTATNQPPQVTVTSPNGGESWPAGATRNITWTATDPDGGPNPLSVAIDWSSNGGGAWQAVATGLTNTGTHAWAVPASATSTARVRVRASDGVAEGQDTSNADFSITAVQPGDNTLAVGSATGSSGASVTLPLSLTSETTVKGLQFDVTYNAAVATFSGANVTGRGAGMTVSSRVVSAGRARVVMYHDDAAVVAVGSGQIANLVFEVTGQPTQGTTVALDDIILSDADAQPLAVTAEPGTITVQASTQAPALQIAVLENPGRTRTLQILVNVTRGSGNLPTVTAGGGAVTMNALGGSRYLGTYAAANDADSVVVTASDTNDQGPSTSQTTVNF